MIIDTIVDYLLFVGSSLYLVAAVFNLYMFLRTWGKKDGTGLMLLRVITLGTAIGSAVVYVTRVLTTEGVITPVQGQAITVINPIILVATALYLNYLFHSKQSLTTAKDNQNLKEIRQDVKEVKKDVKVVKDKVV